MDIKSPFKRICFCYILSILCLLYAGCSASDSIKMRMNEETIYNTVVTNFFTALDNRDSEAIYTMFSPAVQETDTDLQEQITRLLQVYPGPTDNCSNKKHISGSYSTNSGKITASVNSTFPVVSQEKYFWCCLELMYQNDMDESQIGITRILFLTADEMYIMRYDSNQKYSDAVGLTVYADNTLDGEIRAIDGSAYPYTPTETTLNLAEEENFFQKSDHYTDFVKQFGEPNAIGMYYYYELPSENERPRYLELRVDEDTDAIYGANIVDDFGHIKNVWSSEE